MRALGLFAMLCILLTACNAVFGIDERDGQGNGGGAASTLSGSGGSGTATTGGGGSPEPPAGWSGPVTLSQASTVEDLAACQGAEAFTLHRGLTAPAAMCPCECSPPEDISCTVTVTGWDDNNCNQVDDVETLGVGQCGRLDGAVDSSNYATPVPDVSNASCPATALPAVIDQLTWQSHARGCGHLSNAPGSNFPSCIYRSGDVGCPDAGAYTARTLWYGAVEDQRACMADCSCGGVEGVLCNEVVFAYDDTNCNVGGTQLAPAPACASSGFDSARLESVAPSGSCTPNDATPTGDAVATVPTTVCCLP